jgi:hypothetical protein
VGPRSLARAHASYCDLTAHFALDLYGKPLEQSAIYATVFSVTGGICMVLGYSYWRYSLRMIKKAE